MRNFLLLGILVLAVTVASNSLFVVKQTVAPRAKADASLLNWT